MTRDELANHIASLTPAEKLQLADLGDYLGERAGPNNPTGFIAERSVQNLLNQQTPGIQRAIKGLQEVISTPREMPFQPKFSEAENLDHLGFDAYSGQMIQDALDTGDVIAGLSARMGADEPDSTPTDRDIMSAAYDKFVGE